MVKKLLFLATYFPDENSPSRGNWALEQAQAFLESGLEVRVVVPTPWIPKLAGKLNRKLAGYSATPRQLRFGELLVDYPRWPCYPWHTFHSINRRFPEEIISLGWAFAAGSVGRIVHEFQPDALVAHHTLVAGQLALRISEKFRIPYVVTDHEVGDLISCRTNRKVRKIFTAVGKHAERMVVVSKAMEAEAQRSLPDLQFSTIYNGSSFGVFERQWNVDKSEKVRVFCCSKFYGRKDIPLLLRAFDSVVDAGCDLELRLAGDGPDRTKVEECLNKLKHRERVTLVGLLPTARVVQEMRDADIFALVGWAEPFGVVFLEAMASGLPLVVSEDAGIAEVLEDGTTAVFTKPHDQASVERALDKLGRDSALRSSIGRAGQALFASKFKWSTVINEYVRLFGGSRK